MKVLSIILGAIMALLGISLTCSPLATFLASGYYVAILMLAYGVIGIIGAIAKKKYGINLVFSIISLIAGIVMVTLPGMIAVTDFMLVCYMAIWFIVQGIVGIVNSIKAKGLGSKVWGWGLALGIIGVLLGIYSLGHPFLTAVSIGVLIGFYFIQSGINMITIACAVE